MEHCTILETHHLGACTVSLLDNGIYHTYVPGDTVVEREDLEAQHRFFKSRFDGRHKLMILVESGYDSTLSREAREYAQLPEVNATTLATAVVVKSLAERLVTNFIINIVSRQAMKIRLFDDTQKAMRWLLALKDAANPDMAGNRLSNYL